MCQRFVSKLLAPLLLVAGIDAWSAGPVFSILDYGAKSDGTARVTEAIRSAVQAAKSAGGGTVLIPAGSYVTGPIQLASNVTLKVDVGAVLRFEATLDLPVWKGRMEGTETYTPAPLISGDHLENVAIRGRGTVTTVDWRQLAQAPEARTVWASILQRLNLKQPVPDEDLRKSAMAFRPVFIGFNECRNVLVEGIHVVGAPFWTIHLLYSEKVIVRDIAIETFTVPGRDGIDIDSCRDVLIANCYLDTGDDSICLKSGKDADGRRVNRPTENVTITNCVVHHGHGAVAIGSETSGGIRNVVASNIACKFTEKGIRIKSARGRGATIENLRFDNWTMDEVGTGIQVTGYYGNLASEPVSERTPIFRDIAISNMNIHNSPIVVSVEGLSETPVSGLRFTDVVGSGKIGFRAYNTAAMELHHVEINPESGPAFQIRDSKDLELDDVTTRKPLAATPVVRLDRTPGAIVRNGRAFGDAGVYLSVGTGELKNIAQSGNLLAGVRKPAEESSVDYWEMITPATPASAGTAAANGTGKWVGSVLGRNGGSQQLTITLLIQGSNVTGTVASPTGGERQITEGKANGSDISFVVSSQMRGVDQKTIYKGKVGADEIEFASRQVPASGDNSTLGPPALFTATKAR